MRENNSRMDSLQKQLHSIEKSFERELREVTTSLQFSQNELDEQKKITSQLKIDIAGKDDMIKDLQNQIISLKSKVTYQEDNSRRNNLRISGIPEQPGENWEQTADKVKTFLAENMDIRDVSLERAHRVGPLKTPAAAADDETAELGAAAAPEPRRPRTIVAKFSRFRDRDTTLRNAHKLGKTPATKGVYINEDLSHESFIKRRQQIPAMKAAKLNNEIAYWNYTKLITRPKLTTGDSSDRNSTTGTLSRSPPPPPPPGATGSSKHWPPPPTSAGAVTGQGSGASAENGGGQTEENSRRLRSQTGGK